MMFVWKDPGFDPIDSEISSSKKNIQECPSYKLDKGKTQKACSILKK